MHKHGAYTAVAVGTAAVAVSALLQRWWRSDSSFLRHWWWLQQRWLRMHLIEYDLVDANTANLIGGVDISFIKGSETDACAALIVVDATTLEVVYSACRRVVLTAPYIPGFLAFREVTFLIELLNELRATAPEHLPQVILVDGNGILHPNRFGLACHLGVLCGVPTIGVGKSLHYVDGLSRETVKQAAEGCHSKGAHALLVGKSGAVWGAVLRTTSPADNHFKPIVISVGHGISLESALALVCRMTPNHRIPEPVRQADLRSRAWLREHGPVSRLS